MIISGCFCEHVLEEVSIAFSRLSKEYPHSPRWWTSADPLRVQMEQYRQRKDKFSFCLLELGHSSCLALRHETSYFSSPCILELTPAVPLFSGLWHQIKSYHQLFWFSLEDNILWNFLGSIPYEPILKTHLIFYLYMSIGSVFLEYAD